VHRIRILVDGRLAALRDAVYAAVADQADMVVVGDTVREVETLMQAGDTSAEVVVVGASDERLPPVVERLADEYPGIGILVVDLERDKGFAYQLRPMVTQIDRISGPALVAAIRQLATEHDA